ncbi:hypothetical protein JL49_20120 [Pseudoalteromonas luteoviolacea]|nr:hypothetical protein JL49_20120 [Pseudoalteromonas luteoviolacea]
MLFNRALHSSPFGPAPYLQLSFNELTKHAALEKELEKITVYQETISGVNHLVRNLQSNFLIINHSEKLQDDLGEEVIDALNQSSREVFEILDKVGGVRRSYTLSDF